MTWSFWFYKLVAGWGWLMVCLEDWVVDCGGWSTSLEGWDVGCGIGTTREVVDCNRCDTWGSWGGGGGSNEVVGYPLTKRNGCG